MKSKSFLVIGGAGFIGSNLVQSLLVGENRVTVIDDFSRGESRFIEKFLSNPRFNCISMDVSSDLASKMAFDKTIEFGKVDEVWHLAANSDIPAGVLNPSIDLKNTFLTTFYILENMKRHAIEKINFASSSAIYGDLGGRKISENAGPLIPISNYGAMKLASEAQIFAASEAFLETANIFRFPNVVGTPATHGVIIDFINKLKVNNRVLKVLGNGQQKKSYLHVSDLIEAMLFISNKNVNSKREIVNIGPVDNGVTVKWIAQQVVKRISPNANILFGESDRGWVGDVPKFKYSINHLLELGWRPKLSSQDAVIKAIDEIARESGF